MTFWPPHVAERIVADQWVLFLGSGVSSSCRNAAGASPPGWVALLEMLCAKIRDDASRVDGEELIASRQLLAAADHIRFQMAEETNVNEYLRTIRVAVEGPVADRYSPSFLYELLLSLEPHIVFTTNYDKIFEVASKNGYSTHGFESLTLCDDLRRGDPVFVKLHGSIDSMSDIVLTRTDYARLARDGKHVFDALNALSLTTTILFIGYSLDDPDIQLVLQAVGRSRLNPEAHFMLAPEPTAASRAPLFKEAFGVSILSYPAEDHSKAVEALSELSDKVLSIRAERGSGGFYARL